MRARRWPHARMLDGDDPAPAALREAAPALSVAEKRSHRGLGTVRAIRPTSVVGTVLLAAACGEDTPERHQPDVPDVIEVRSPAFADGEPIPARFTCDGAEVSPPLAWSGVRQDARAVALVVDDPDAPSGTYTHWVVVDIPASTTSSVEGEVPNGGTQADSSAGDTGYAGPCPPSGTHHYRFTIVALDQLTGLAEGAPLDDALAAVDDHAIARGTLTGTCSRE